MKKKIVISGLVIILTITLLACTEFPVNIWLSITAKEFIIPEESSIFTLKVTKMNNGSGEWWLYSEDKNYYYTMEETVSDKPYSKISKEDAKNIISFDKFDYMTWQL